MKIISPEPETAFPVADQPVMVTVQVGGDSLRLVDPGSDPGSEFGQGNVVLYLDGVEIAVLAAGDLTTGVPIEVPVPPIPGAHRLVAKARLSNNTFYDNEGSEARQLFWLNDGKPHVGFIHPYPGDVFSLEPALIPFTIAALNYDFVKPNPSVNESPGQGHAHVHYNHDYPGCAFDNACDNLYVGVVAPEGPQSSATSALTIPASAAGEAKLTAALQQINHFKFLDEDGQPVWEDIIILRDAATAPPPDPASGGESGTDDDGL
jgi:hypothetical protein